MAVVSIHAVRQCRDAWDRYADAKAVIATNATVDSLLDAAQNLAFERGRAILVLRGPNPIEGDDRAFIAARRAASVAILDDALSRAAPGLEHQAGEVRSGYQRVIALRPEVDTALGLPQVARDPTLGTRWFLATSGLLRDMAGLASALAARHDRLTPDFSILSRVKGLAFDFRDVVGVESTRIAIGMGAGAYLTSDVWMEIMRLRGQSVAHWAALRREVALSDNPVLRGALEGVTAEFFGRFRPLEDQVIAATLAGRAYPLSAKAFTQASVPALDSIVALVKAATAETTLYAQANMERAGRAVVFHLASGLLAIALGMATVLVIVGRLLGPLDRIRAHLASLAAGEVVPEPSFAPDRGDEIGRMQRAVTALQDSLIERRRVEVELRSTSTRLALVLETAGEGIFGINGDGSISFANGSVAELLGFPSVELLLGRPSAEALGHRLADGRSCMESRCFIGDTLRDGQTRRVSGEFFRRADGTDIPIEYVVSAQKVGDAIIGVVVAVHDVIAHQRGEREMREVVARQQAILRNTPIGIAIINLDRRIVEANDAFCRVFGSQGEDLAGTPTSALYADAERYEDIGRRAYPLVRGGGVFEDELVMRRGDGGDVWARIVAHMVDVDAPELGVVWAAEDVSVRKALELEIKRSNAELERFAYVASHDLRQPLRMVSSYLTLLERRLEARLDEDERQFIDFAVDGARRMDRMIVDLLDYSRIGRQGAAAAVVPLGGVLRQVLDNLGAAIAEAGAEVIVPAGLPQIFGHESEMVRLFQNLIGNAIKFRAPGCAPCVTVECLDMAREWIITIADDGIGIAPEDHDRLFSVFQRLVPQEQYEGNGIGLAVCRKICENNGGRIWVESALGRGSTFLVALPKLV